MKESDKERVQVEVVQRVFDRYGKSPQKIEQALFDAIYEERRRLETERDRKKAARESAFYGRVYREATRTGPERQRELLKEVLKAFVKEVTGHFDPRVYTFSTRVAPHFLSVVLNTLSPLRLLGVLPGGLGTLDDQIVIEGETEALKTLHRLGTTMVVSTHSSNLDSIVLGYVLYRLGLPPYNYGAGLNLFSHKTLGFFMDNLGAYKVDRRKKAEVYKEVLKTYAGCSMELDYHNMFFPGGTRSRSGFVERKLKLGLLGMGLDAYIHNLIGKRERPDVFIVPCTINYQLVLEAETLIGDYLKAVGKSRYIIEDDEFSKPKRILDFFTKLFSLNSRIHVVFSRPLDVFGNVVDEEGRSLDRRGRVLDRRKFVFSKGRPAFDRQRDGEYAHELARALVEAYHQATVIKSTNLVSYAVFNWLLDRGREIDFYRLLRTGGPDESLPLTEAYERVGGTLVALRRLEEQGRVRLDDTLKEKDTITVVSEALAHLKSYHRRPALVRRGDRLFHVDRNLLYYYQNRLDGFGLPVTEKPQ